MMTKLYSLGLELTYEVFLNSKVTCTSYSNHIGCLPVSMPLPTKWYTASVADNKKNGSRETTLAQSGLITASKMLPLTMDNGSSLPAPITCSIQYMNG